MLISNYIEIICFYVVLILCSYPLGVYIYKVLNGQRTFFSFILVPSENFVYKLCSIDKNENQTWVKYSINILLFSFFSFFLTYIFLRNQSVLPFNSENFPSLSEDLAFNTAVSFLTNTNWQAYGGESTLSYFSQMFALVPQNFTSAAMGIAACIAIARGLTGENAGGFLGNFWVDLTRIILYILLPISFFLAIFFVAQGAIQNFLPYIQVKTLEGIPQLIAQGPTATQAAIKLLGTNGGGFFNSNSAHPFENPTALTSFVQALTIVLIPSSLVFTFGKMSKHMKHAVSIWIAMFVMSLISVFILTHYELVGNLNFIDKLHLSSALNMEGKETRFGVFDSSLFTAITTQSSCGAVVSPHGSYTPIGQFITLLNMLLGEIIFGGVGSGLYGILIFVILAVFIAGLMVGRTPEYLGKKIESLEIKLTMIPLIAVCAIILIFLAIASLIPGLSSSVNVASSHRFTEIFYAFVSTAQNNGSSFASLNTNTPFWNYSTSVTMLVGRYFSMLPMLALAGYMVRKKVRPITENTFPVHGGLFILLLIGIIIIVGALTYLPSLALGPVLEQLNFLKGNLYSAGAVK